MSSKKTTDVIFRRSKGGDECEIESWDDNVLMKAYDASVSMSNEILMSPNEEESPLSQEEEGEELMFSPNQNEEVIWSRTPGVEIRNFSETSKAKKAKKEDKFCKNKDSKWCVEDDCMAIYYGDNLYYRATILSIHDSDGYVVVNFNDYNEESEVALEDIYPVSMFVNDNAEEMTFSDYKFTEETELKNVSNKKQNKKKSHSKKQRQSHDNFNRGEPNNINPSLLFPPPPPISGMSTMPMFDFAGTNGLPPQFTNTTLPDLTKEALSSMLVSWYMAGYHTGYYRGLSTQIKSKSNKNSQS